MHAGHVFARYEPAADPSPPPQERTQGLPAIQIDQAQLVEACSEGDIDLYVYIYISIYIHVRQKPIYIYLYIDIYICIQMGLPFFWEGMAPKCRWSRNLYIYPPLGKNGASTAWYLICVHLYIVLVQTRTGEYVYIYTHIYISPSESQLIRSLHRPPPPMSHPSASGRAG